MIQCNTQICPYNEEGLCSKRVLKLNQNGQCSFVWKDNGQTNQHRIQTPIDKQFKQIEKIIDGNFIKENDNGIN